MIVPTSYPFLFMCGQKYKAFAAEITELQKVLKKKGADAAASQFANVEEALDIWLAEIDLPAAKEL